MEQDPTGESIETQEDVNEEGTTQDSSPETDQTSETPNVSEDAKTQETEEDNKEVQIPRERFNEVNEKRKAVVKENEELKKQLDGINAKFSNLSTALNPKEEEKKPTEEVSQATDFVKGIVAKEFQDGISNYTKTQTEIAELSAKFNGEDGSPKYSEEEVKTFSKEKGVKGLSREDTYFLLNREKLETWKTEQIAKKRPYTSMGVQTSKNLPQNDVSQLTDEGRAKKMNEILDRY